ncbi:MAG: DMT family transporter [Pseudomonadales bacterium]
MAFGLASVGCWATVATAFKLALARVDVWQLVFWSTLTASVALLLMVALTGQRRALVAGAKAHGRISMAAGLLNPTCYYLVLFKAYELLPAQVAQPINYTWAIMLTLMAMVFLGQRVRAWDLIAAGVCYGGVFLIATQGDPAQYAGANMTGVGLALLSTLVWAGYWIINMRDERQPLVGLCLNFIMALPITLALCLAFSDLGVSGGGLLGCIYVGLVEMAIAFVFWARALRLASNASRVANLIFLSPFLSLVIIHYVLGEDIHGTTIVGLVCIVGGLLFQQWMNRRSGARASA